jgi:hypothetical protein
MTGSSPKKESKATKKVAPAATTDVSKGATKKTTKNAPAKAASKGAAKAADSKPAEKKSSSKTQINPTVAPEAISAAARLLELSDNGKWKELYPPLADESRSLSALRADLADVPVLCADGKVTNVYHKIESEALLKRQDKDIIWRCLTLVREAYLKLETAETDGAHRGYQWNMNWKHTRAELDQVYEASKILNLSSDEMRDAIIASIFSDAVKTRGNFIIHNIHGSQAAAQALSYLWDDGQECMKSVERIVLAIKQHQIAPPSFMANTVAIMLSKKLNLDPFERYKFNPGNPDPLRNRNQHLVCSIHNKIKNPFDKRHLTKDLGLIKFTPDEHEILKLIAIDEWYVPHPDVEGSKIAHALIAGDHSINYNNPDGFAKIALIRGPATESMFEDATIYDSLESAMASFADSFNILLPEVKNLALVGIRRTQMAVIRVLRIMTELLSGVTVGPRDSLHLITGSERVELAMERARQKQPDVFHTDAAFSSETGHKYRNRSMERVGSILQEWQNEYGDIPFSPRPTGLVEPGPGRLPFWNVPLKYPKRGSNGEQLIDTLTHHEQTQFAFAMRIREIAVELLRAEQWFYS